jgi:hypothetical protein
MTRPGWGIRHGAGSRAMAGHQNSSAVRDEQDVLQVVQPGVLERRVEQRREVGAPHHPGEQQPGDDRVGQPANDPRVEDRQEVAPPDVRPGGAQGERHRPDRAISGAATRISSTCWTMWIENRRGVVLLDARLERERDREQPAEERERPRRGHGVGRMGGVHAPDGDDPGERRPSSGSRTSGSNDQPNRMFATDGGSAGTGRGRGPRRGGQPGDAGRAAATTRHRPRRPNGDERSRDGSSPAIVARSSRSLASAAQSALARRSG